MQCSLEISSRLPKKFKKVFGFWATTQKKKKKNYESISCEIINLSVKILILKSGSFIGVKKVFPGTKNIVVKKMHTSLRSEFKNLTVYQYYHRKS